MERTKRSGPISCENRLMKSATHELESDNYFIRNTNEKIPEIITKISEDGYFILIARESRLTEKKLRFLSWIWFILGSIWVIISLFVPLAAGGNRIAFLGYFFWILSVGTFLPSIMHGNPRNGPSILAKIEKRSRYMTSFGEQLVSNARVQKIYVLSGKDTKKIRTKKTIEFSLSIVRQVILQVSLNTGEDRRVLILSGILSSRTVMNLANKISESTGVAIQELNDCR